MINDEAYIISNYSLDSDNFILYKGSPVWLSSECFNFLNGLKLPLSYKKRNDEDSHFELHIRKENLRHYNSMVSSFKVGFKNLALSDFF